MAYDAAPFSGYEEPFATLTAILQDGTREWREELDPLLNEAALAWQPEPGAASIGAIIFHMIAAEVFWFEEFVLGEIMSPEERVLIMRDAINVDECQWPEPPRKPLAWYFELQDRIRARTLEAVKRWPPAEVVKDLHGTARSMRWVFGHVIQHDSYHGGQIVLLQQLWKKRAEHAQGAR